MFVKDPQDLVKDYLEEHGNGGVTEVMGVERLRKEYGTHEGRRELLNMYDLFLVDNRVSPMMPGLLGNAFLAAKKMPLQVDMRKDVVKQIRKAISSTALNLRQGTSTTLRVGRIDFTAEQIVENLVMAVDGVVRRLSGGWHDIQSLNLKTSKSLALPIYLTLPTASLPYANPERAEKMTPGKLNDDIPNEKEIEAVSTAEAIGGRSSSDRRTQNKKKRKNKNRAATKDVTGNDGSDGNDVGPTAPKVRVSLSEPEAKATSKTVKRKKEQTSTAGTLARDGKNSQGIKPTDDRSGEDVEVDSAADEDERATISNDAVESKDVEEATSKENKKKNKSTVKRSKNIVKEPSTTEPEEITVGPERTAVAKTSSGNSKIVAEPMPARRSQRGKRKLATDEACEVESTPVPKARRATSTKRSTKKAKKADSEAEPSDETVRVKKKADGEKGTAPEKANAGRPPTEKRKKGTESGGGDPAGLTVVKIDKGTRGSSRVTRGMRPGSAASTNAAGEQAQSSRATDEDEMKEAPETRRSTRKRMATSDVEKGATDVVTTPATKFAAASKSRSMRKSRSTKK